MNRKKLTDLHNLNMLVQQDNVGIHYDMYPITGESINIIAFELLILSCINNGS